MWYLISRWISVPDVRHRILLDFTVINKTVPVDNVSTCLSLYEHQCVLSGGPFQELLCQTTTTGLQQPGNNVKMHISTYKLIYDTTPLCHSGTKTHQLKEECRLAQRLGCCVRDVNDRAALPLLWCGKTAGENTLFILTERWGQTPCSLSNT